MRLKLADPKPTRFGDEKHHIFNGACRNASECWNCAIYVDRRTHEAIHHGLMAEMKELYQRKLLDAGWTMEEFIETFHKNYLR